MKTIFTKTILLGTIITVGLFSTSKAQSAYDDQYNGQYNDQYSYSQPAPAYGDQSFYYYPDANVYYDVNCNKYIYNNGGGWLTVNVLPSNICLTNIPRFTVYHRGPQVWLDNAVHMRNYRPAYRQPIVAFNTYRGNRWNGYFNRRDFDRRDNRGNGRDRGDREDRGDRGGRRW